MADIDLKLDTSSQPRDQTSARPAPLQAPIFPTRDAADPLDPHRLASEELTIRQLLQEADRVIDTVRVNSYNEYRRLIGLLEGYFTAYRHYSAWGEYDFHRADLYMRDLGSIKIEGIDGLKARDEARKAVGDRWSVWWQVYNTFKALARRYAVLAQIKENLVAGITRPPSQPPELV